jgi:chromosome segregation protein
MAARLKSFELQGYKTFASRTEFVFADGVTAIVGPNGSGKSNIADALRWVLGEQSFGLLRAKKTEDMIFAGSEHRPRSGMASATIVFDNSDGWLPIDFSEVGITRRAYRDGDNEYLLNGQRVRLKDVSELLAQSGLAERTYTVIGQGLVDAALSLKAEERRRFFEEAAGIGLHRARRDEALRRLEVTQRNLERVQDILFELQPRLRSLERQARRYQEYEHAREDLKVLLREWYGYHWHLAQAELLEAKKAAKKQEITLDKVRHEQAGLDENLSNIRGRGQALRNQIKNWNTSLSNAYSQREQLVREQAIVEERTRSLEEISSQTNVEILRLQDETNFYQEQTDHISLEIERLLEQKGEAELNLDEANRVYAEKQEQIANVEREIKVIRQNINDLAAHKSVLQAQLLEKQSSIAQRAENINKIKSELRQIEKELALRQSSLLVEIEKKKEADSAIVEAEAAWQANRLELRQLETLRKDVHERIVDVQATIAGLQTQFNVLEQADDSLSGYADGAKLLVKAMRDSRIAGARGAISNYIEVPEKFENAIASALGEYLGAMLVDGWQGVDDALNILDGGSARGAMLLLDSAALPKPLNIDLDKAPVNKDSIIGLASEVIKVQSDLQLVVNRLLGQVLIVKDRESARRLITRSNWSTMPALRIVTLSGEVFHSNGQILSASKGQGILSRPRIRKELDADIKSYETILSAYHDKIVEIDEKYSLTTIEETKSSKKLQKILDLNKSIADNIGKLELSVEQAVRSKTWQQERLETLEIEIHQAMADEGKLSGELTLVEREIVVAREQLNARMIADESESLDEYQSQVSYWLTQTAVVVQALADAEKNRLRYQEVLSRIVNTLEAINTRRFEFEMELVRLTDSHSSIAEKFLAITTEIENLRELVLPAEAELFDVEKTLNQWVTTDTNMRQALSLAEHQYSQAKIFLARRQETLDSLRQRIEDDFGLVSFDYEEAVSGPKPLPIDGLVVELPKVVELAVDLDENVQRQRALLRRIGPINPEAQTEYQHVKERYEFLTGQTADLHKAEQDIREVISELDLLMEREFRKTFDAVAMEFRQIFTRLFGGGVARLVLTDPNEMTDTGIDIEARLPGRREQGLSLLSGGERSLTATALVFALLRISPTPFCILDEVDAMLDEANVGRFRELLTELSAHTQFIIITHNRNTVQAASVIYGVTMGRDSASQVIGLQLDELTEDYGV